MGGNADALKERYRRFGEGDVEGALDLWTDDFVWEGPDADGFPGAGRHEGKEAAVAVLQEAVGAWDSFSLEPDEFYEQDDTVIVLGHTDVSKDDRSARVPVVHIWRMGGDGEINRLQILTDTLVGGRVLGIA